MVPYVSVGPIELFGIEFQPFFMLVAMGIVAGVLVYDRLCRFGGLIDRKVALHLPEIAVLGGFIGAHLVHVLVYNPESMVEDPFVLLKIWGGFSSAGGFLGGALGSIAYLRFKKQKVLPYADRILFGLTVGWIFGRTGCAVTHDHPGVLSDFPLAVAFPGGARHDLGMYELFLTIIIFCILLFLSRKPRFSGFQTALILLIYSPIRFMLDFLRAEDVAFADRRYLGLTFAQYAMFVLFGAGLALVLTRKRRAIDKALLSGKKRESREIQSDPGDTGDGSD